MALKSNLPLDMLVEQAIIDAGFRYHAECAESLHLDFFLPDLNVYIEVKSGHSDRIAAQMSRAANVIALQGDESVRLFCRALKALPR